MVKDRLAEFQRKSGLKLNDISIEEDNNDCNNDLETGRYNNSIDKKLISNNKNSNLDNVELFLNSVSIVHKNIKKLDELLQVISGKHNQILISPGVQSEVTKELNDCVDEFKVISSSTRDFVKRLNNDLNQLESNMSTTAYRIERAQVMAINKKLNNLLQAFNEEQLKYKDRCTDKINNFLKITDREMKEEDVDEAIRKGRLYDLTEGLILATREKQMLYEDVKSRQEDILRLEASIREMHDIFHDMQLLVESQGGMIDNIEMNVNNAVEYALNAQKMVHQAKEARASGRKKKIILVIVLIIVIFLLFSILKSLFCLYIPVCRK
ncbi:Syntaxin-4 [Strongyloides ratti]|uniref:Syntaxin-4 n=1 Tax=Strongyloides ratti TaxID=34506 RepID=A0A090LNS0_STRRB|nr:Syntaxin-4 [Strongyloides ratti]CEF71510.1 Syntaxin-4 [Strongyloides ratti]